MKPVGIRWQVTLFERDADAPCHENGARPGVTGYGDSPAAALTQAAERAAGLAVAYTRLRDEGEL